MPEKNENTTDNTLIPVELTLFVEHGLDINRLNEMEKTEQRLSFCADLSESVFKVIRVAAENEDGEDLSHDIANLSRLGVSISRMLLDQIDKLSHEIATNSRKDEDSHSTFIS